MTHKSLVTGGAGFIGSHIVDRLLDLGHEVVVIDNESSDGHDDYHWNRHGSVHNHKVDIRDYEAIKHLFAGVDYVFHLAAKASVQASVDNPLPTISTQVMGTANVLEAARQAGVEKFVYSSTSACYGNSNPIPNVETMREDPLNAYAIGKLSGEQLVRSYYHLYGMKTVAFRYTNVYGERARHVGTYAPAVSKFIKMRDNGDALTIFGDGLQRRDFIHVSDVVSANCCITYEELDQWGETYNIGYGKNWSIQEIADAINTDEQVHLSARPGEMRETLADIRKAKAELTWKPKVDIMDWIRTQL
jgi:UDP-glucose 4-epimerase